MSTTTDLSQFTWHQFQEYQVKELYEAFQMFSNKNQQQQKSKLTSDQQQQKSKVVPSSPSPSSPSSPSSQQETISIREMRSLIETFVGLEFTDEQMIEFVTKFDPKLIEEQQKVVEQQQQQQQEANNQVTSPPSSSGDDQQQQEAESTKSTSTNTSSSSSSSSNATKSLLDVQVNFQMLLNILNDRFRPNSNTKNNNSDDPYEHLQELFNMFDMNENGVIGVAELGHFFKHVLGEQLSDTELTEMMKDVKTKNPGVITLDEFRELVKELDIDSS